MAYDAEEAARRAEEAADRAEQAAMLADLSEERRAQLAVPDAPPEHILAEDPRTQAQAKLIARGSKIRSEAKDSKDPNAVKRADWYPDVPVNEDGDRFSGQGHRDRQLAQQNASFGRPGARPAQQGPQTSRSNLGGGGGGGPPQTRAAARRTVMPASSRVQRPPSPRAFGTVRFPPASRPILPATGAQRTSSNASTGPRQSAAMIAAQKMAFALGSNGADCHTSPAQAPLPAFRQPTASNGPTPSTLRNNPPRTSTPPAPPGPKASTTTAPSAQVAAKKGPASTTSSATSGNGIVRVSANAISAQNTLRAAGIQFIIEGSEEQATLSFSSPSPQQTPQPTPAPPREPIPSPTRSQASAPLTGAPALISHLHGNPTGAAAKRLNSMGIISTEPRVLPPKLTPPSFPTGGRPYPTSPQQSVFSYSRAASPAPQSSSARPATMQPTTQANTFATGLGASRYADGEVPAVSSSSAVNGHAAPPSAATTVPPHMAAQPNNSSPSTAPTRRTRTAVPRGVALASASTATQLPAEDVVMGGTTAASSTLAPANSDFTFSMPTTGTANAPSTQQPAASSTTAAPTSTTFITPALPVTRSGVDASTPIHRMQAQMYAGDLTPEGAVKRVQYYERFPERLHFLEEARDQLIREGRPTYLDVMDTEPSKPMKKKESESDKKPDTKPVKQETQQVATPVTRSSTSRISLAPHLRNGTASPAPHLRRAAAVVAPASSPAEVPAAGNTSQQAIKTEPQDSPNVSLPSSEAPASTNAIAPSSSSPAAQAHDARAAAAVATANGANIAQGMLSVIFQDANGNFLGNRSIPVDAPVQANLNITSRHIEFNPMDLANEMAAFAAAMRLHIDGVKLKRGDGGPWEEDKKKE